MSFTKTCAFCKAEIPYDAKRCMYCTADFEAEALKEQRIQEAAEREQQRQARENALVYQRLLDQHEATRKAQAEKSMQLEIQNLEICKSWTEHYCIEQINAYIDFLNSPGAVIPILSKWNQISQEMPNQWGFWYYFDEFKHAEQYLLNSKKYFEDGWQYYVTHQASPLIRNKWNEAKAAQQKRQEKLRMARAIIDEWRQEELDQAQKWRGRKDHLEWIFMVLLILSFGLAFFFRETPVWALPGAAASIVLIVRKWMVAKMTHYQDSKKWQAWWQLEH